MKRFLELQHTEEEKIKELLLYRKVIEVKGDSLFLDNGVELEIIPNEGCGGCGAGWYAVEELNSCDNAITNIEFVCDDLGNYGEEFSYKIFVLAENNRIKLLQVDGSDGNGYYGTGYEIRVKPKITG